MPNNSLDIFNINAIEKNIRKNLKKILIVILLFLLVTGVLSVGSISKPIAEYSNNKLFNTYLISMIIAIIVALFTYFAVRFDVDEKTLFIIYFFGLIFLVSPLIFGVRINGARRWIRIAGISVQPSEIIKPVLIYILAIFFSNKKRYGENSVKTFWTWIIALGTYAIIVLLGKALSSTLQITVLAFLMFCVSKIEYKYKIYIMLMGIFASPIPIIAKSYRAGRIKQLLSGGSTQTLAGINAIKSGSIFGRGFGLGIQKYFYLSEAHTDYMFASISEEMGLIFILVLLTAFFVLISLIFYVGLNIKNSVEKYVILGVGFVLTNQIVGHIGINLNILPSTGITLPFISYGGSALMSNLICVALLFKALKSIEWVEK